MSDHDLYSDFALCIGKIIAQRKTKRNMYPASTRVEAGAAGLGEPLVPILSIES